MPVEVGPNNSSIWNPEPGELVFIPAVGRFYLALSPSDKRDPRLTGVLWEVLVLNVPSGDPEDSAWSRVQLEAVGKPDWFTQLIGALPCR